MKNILLYVFNAITIILILWVFVSWLDINAHNMTDQMFHDWNFFVLMVRGWH